MGTNLLVGLSVNTLQSIFHPDVPLKLLPDLISVT